MKLKFKQFFFSDQQVVAFVFINARARNTTGTSFKEKMMLCMRGLFEIMGATFLKMSPGGPKQPNLVKPPCGNPQY